MKILSGLLAIVNGVLCLVCLAGFLMSMIDYKIDRQVTSISLLLTGWFAINFMSNFHSWDEAD